MPFAASPSDTAGDEKMAAPFYGAAIRVPRGETALSGGRLSS